MFFDIASDIVKLGFFAVCAYMLVNAYARRTLPHWAKFLTKFRLDVIATLSLALGGLKLIEDVVAKESGPVDEAVLWFFRDHIPASMNGFFATATLSGSARFLIPLTAVSVVLLLVNRRRYEAVLIGVSVIVATLTVWIMKAIVGRARPELWEAQWYWGSSFPSGHTLSTAAFSTAAALCAARIWPRTATLAMALAVLWTGLIAVSRLILGVHWPSDVLAAICFGAVIPLLINVVSELLLASSHDHDQ
ncbi:phosphatase PAP2 family protein [Hydrogenophaga sp.]|uniref:phosphatase PAP2 family protein n=1 Tax=Hydrogenophaga sp. TaxID=1904254 RepID=UPI0025C4594B|nr:phosphatase PAP2 family protein [Hydrogenophaga sp.]MBT9466281.1 phosphatase PAP2 family protein [Hydrogenophaga sp.]